MASPPIAVPPGGMLVSQAPITMFGAKPQDENAYRVLQFGGAQQQQAAGPGPGLPSNSGGGGCGPADYPRVSDLGVNYQPERFDFLSRLSHNGPDDAKARPNDELDFMRLRWSANSSRLGAHAGELATRNGWFSQMRGFAGIPVAPPRAPVA